jgi:lipoprotein-anchoring transpeptidase ErfK/SrfK
VRVKRTLACISGLAAAGLLAACSSGVSASGGQPVNAALPVAPSTTTTTAPPPSSSSVPAPPPSTTTSKTTTKTTPKPPPKPAPAPGVPCAITSGACVDLSARKVWLLEGGKVVYGPVAMMPGKSGSTTPLGTFHVLSKVKDYHSREFDAPMPNSAFFYPGDAFHAGSLRALSNGCIHLSTSASLKLFNTLQVGDPVQVVR